MKHTDFAIIFILIFMSIVIEFDFKMSALHEIQNQRILYNNIFDTAAIDALRNAVVNENGNAEINEELVIRQFFEGLGELVEIDISSFPVMIITNSKGFAIWDNGIRNEFIYEDPSVETKVNKIRTAVEDALNSSTAALYNGYRYCISIPYVKVSEWYNTISDMGFLVVFQGDTFNNDRMFNRYIISGASFTNSEPR